MLNCSKKLEVKTDIKNSDQLLSSYKYRLYISKACASWLSASSFLSSFRNDNLVYYFVCSDINFGGHIVYSRTVKEVERAAQELLDFAEAKKRNEGQCILGLDIEWRPTFRRGKS